MKIIALFLFITLNLNSVLLTNENIVFESMNMLDPGLCDCNWDPITADCWKDRGDSYCFAEKMGPSRLCDACVIINP